MSSVFDTPLLTPLLRGIARLGLRLSGWRVDSSETFSPPFVFIGAPHTSNWDFMLMLAMLLHLHLDARWLGKHTLFRFPFGGLMRWLGGIPVDRSQPQNLVPETAQWLRSNPHTVLCVPPEGTRKKVDHWKTGFYFIALRAGVPILMTAVDGENRKIRVLGTFLPSGEAEREILEIQQHYVKFRGIVAENTCDFSGPLNPRIKRPVVAPENSPSHDR